MSPSGAVGGAGVLVRLGPGRLSLAQELHGREEAVEVRVGDDGIDGSGALDHLLGDQLGARVGIAVRNQAEARVPADARPPNGVLVVIDPDRQPSPQRIEERHRHLLEALPSGERDVEHRDTALGRRGESAGLLDEHHAHGTVEYASCRTCATSCSRQASSRRSRPRKRSARP